MAIPLQKRSYYEFGQFRIDPLGRLLLHGDEVVSTTPKQFDILLLLVENRGQVVEKERLLEEVWPDTSVEEGNLTTNIYGLRKALGEAGNGQQYIQTVPRRGYRFVGEVREVLAEEGRSIAKEVSPLHLVTPQGGDEQLPEKAPTLNMWDRLRARRKVAWAGLALVAVAIAVVTIWIVNRTTTGSGGGVKTLAVLPFKPLVADSRNESLEQGMAETLINKLSSIRQLIVRPISSVSEYIDSTQDAVAIGQELGVDYVLEGRLQMEGEKTRATVRLMSVKDGMAVWTDTCDEQCSTIFELQDAIATRIAASLAIKLSGDERNRLARHDTDSTDAYQAYMWGRFLLNKRDPRTIEKSIEYLEQAIRLDPNFAPAYVALADTYAAFSWWRGLSSDEVRAKRRELVAKALAIDDTLAEAHATWGNIKAGDRDWPGAEQAFKRALELSPNSAEVHGEYAVYLWNRKRFDDALAEKWRAVELEPTSALHNRNVAIYLYFLRRYDEAIEQGLKALELDDDMPTTYRWLAQSYEEKGLYDQAIEAYLKTAEFNDYGPKVEAALRAAYAMSGWQGFWRKSVELKLERAKQRKVSSWAFAQTYVRLGEKDQAFAWLEKLVEEGGAMRIMVDDHVFDDLRSDPRYAALLQRANGKP